MEEMENLKSLTALRALSKDSNYSIASVQSMTTQSSTTPSPAYYDTNTAINSHWHFNISYYGYHISFWFIWMSLIDWYKSNLSQINTFIVKWIYFDNKWYYIAIYIISFFITWNYMKLYIFLLTHSDIDRNLYSLHIFLSHTISSYNSILMRFWPNFCLLFLFSFCFLFFYLFFNIIFFLCFEI